MNCWHILLPVLSRLTLWSWLIAVPPAKAMSPDQKPQHSPLERCFLCPTQEHARCRRGRISILFSPREVRPDRAGCVCRSKLTVLEHHVQCHRVLPALRAPGEHRPPGLLVILGALPSRSPVIPKDIVPLRHRRQEHQSTLLPIASSAAKNKRGIRPVSERFLTTFPCFSALEEGGYFLKYPTQKSRHRGASATFISDVMSASESPLFLQKNLLIFCPIWDNIHPDSFIECQFLGL